MAAITTITNTSTQTVPVLVGSIPVEKTNQSSQISALKSQPVSIAPGAKLTVETQRLDKGQIIQLSNMKLITYDRI